MRKSLGALVGGVLLYAMSPAVAADMPVKAGYAPAPVYYNWTGFYVGVNGGYGWGNSSWTAGPVTTGSFNVSGALIGATLGYNLQFSNFVAGVEGDWDYSTVRGSTGTLVCAPGTCTTRVPWLATIRGRLGYAFDRWLPFITVGGVAADVKATSPIGTESKTGFGWTFGGGVEAALWQNWTWKVEYLYAKLGNGECNATCGAVPTATVDTKLNIIRAGLNYRF